MHRGGDRVYRRRLVRTVIFMIVAGMGGWFLGIWFWLLVLGLGSLVRVVERRITPKRLADVRIPRYVAVPVILLPIALAFFIIMSLNGRGGARLPDDHVGRASPASLRAIFLFRIGPSFGGLRLAVRPGFIDWPEGCGREGDDVSHSVALGSTITRAERRDTVA